MVLVLYQQDVLQTCLLVKACRQLGVPCCVVRNMIVPLPQECKCTSRSKKCHFCVHASDVAKLAERKLKTTVGGQEASVPVVFVSSISSDTTLLRSHLHANGIVMSGEMLDMVSAMSSHAEVDSAWINKMLCHLGPDQPDVTGAEEILQVFSDSELMTLSDVQDLRRASSD